jgi:alpha 1,6-mannosyltransferase
MTDILGDIYVKETFKSRPEIIETYLALPIPILKADLLRYLLLHTEGGIWSDLDVSCEDVPIHDWIPAQYKKEASLVVGWEFDIGWGDNVVRQFAS